MVENSEGVTSENSSEHLHDEATGSMNTSWNFILNYRFPKTNLSKPIVHSCSMLHLSS